VGLHHQKANFFRAVTFLVAGGVHPKNAEQAVGCAVERPNEWRHDAREDDERPCYGFGGLLGAGQRHGFWRELSQNYMKKGEKEECDRYCRDVSRGWRGVQPCRAEKGVEQMGQRRLANPAETQRCHGDSKLRGGDVAV